MPLKGVMHAISLVFEISGVACIIIGFVLALVRAVGELRSSSEQRAYSALRQTFGRSILLGLEILVAADLIRTISIDPTLENLAVLAGLILVRTFLSWSLEVEIDGRWPWQRGSADGTDAA